MAPITHSLLEARTYGGPDDKVTRARVLKWINNSKQDKVTPSPLGACIILTENSALGQLLPGYNYELVNKQFFPLVLFSP